MEVLYHISPYFQGIFPYIHRPYIGLIYGRYLQFRILKWPVTILNRVYEPSMAGGRTSCSLLSSYKKNRKNSPASQVATSWLFFGYEDS